VERSGRCRDTSRRLISICSCVAECGLHSFLASCYRLPRQLACHAVVERRRKLCAQEEVKRRRIVARPDIALSEDRHLLSGARQGRLRLERSRKQMLNSLLANGESWEAAT